MSPFRRSIIAWVLLGVWAFSKADAAFVLPYPSDFCAQDHWFSLGAGLASSGASKITPYGIVSLNLVNHVHFAVQEAAVFGSLSELTQSNASMLQGASFGLYQFMGNVGIYGGMHWEQQAFFPNTVSSYANRSYQVYGILKVPHKKVDVTVNSDGKVNVFSPGYLLCYGGLRQTRFDTSPFASGATRLYHGVLGLAMYGGNTQLDRSSINIEAAYEIPLAGCSSGGSPFVLSVGLSVPLFGSDQDEMKVNALR